MDYRDKIAKLQRKADDPSVTSEERQLFLEKIKELQAKLPPHTFTIEFPDWVTTTSGANFVYPSDHVFHGLSIDDLIAETYYWAPDEE